MPDAPSPTVLVVEDEPLVRELLTDTLRTEGYRVADAGNAAEAERLADELDRLDVLVADILLPQSSGFELACKIRRRHGSLGLVFVTGWRPDEVEVPEEVARPYQVLRKPLGGQDLIDAVAAAVV
jgi:two-component system, cell cycle sensor histidine kinase and response regulator CckA